MKWIIRGVFVVVMFVILALIGFALFHLWDAFGPKRDVPTPFVKLEELHLPPREGSGYGAIIFIHGLEGNYLDTWRVNEKTAHFMTLLNEDKALAKYDVYSLGYPTKIAADMTSISAVIGGVADFLDQRTKDHSRIVLVCHSLGGIIGRGALARSDFVRRPYQRCTFITLGTPFGGSQLADYGKALGGLASYQMQALKRFDPNSEILNGDWRKTRSLWGPKLRHYCGYETKPVEEGFLVVEQSSATEGHQTAFGDEIYGFDCNHKSISKPPVKPDSSPPQSDSILFQKVKEWILGKPSGEALALAPNTPPMKAGVMTIEGEFPVTEDLTIEPGCRLEIKPGTVVKVRGGAILDFQGIITAKGEAGKEIVFDFDKDSAGEGALLLRGPFAEGSVFTHCRFVNGNGVALEKDDPRRDEQSDPALFWYQRTQRARADMRTRYRNRYGGGLLVWNATDVQFDNCHFEANESWTGGAAAIFNSRLVRFNHCTFKNNMAGYGGGGLLLQSSAANFNTCLFESNRAGFLCRPPRDKTAEEEQLRGINQLISRYYSEPPDEKTLKSVRDGAEFACGGALYLGYRSQITSRSCTFKANEASYVGGAVYLIETHPVGSGVDASLISDPVFETNASRRGGGGMWIDDSSLVHLTRSDWRNNVAVGPFPDKFRGHDLVDRSRVARPPWDSGLKLLDKTYAADEKTFEIDPRDVWFEKERSRAPDSPPSPESQVPQRQNAPSVPPIPSPNPGSPPAASTRAAQEYMLVAGPAKLIDRPPEITNELMINPKSFRRGAGRLVDTIVVHHVSAINWETDTLLRTKHRARVEAFEKAHPSRNRKFDWATCKEIFEIYGVSAHYLIDREGRIRRLVAEQDVAFHAGESRMPDGRKGVNEFSIGIEMISTHPDDDPEVKSGTLPAYTDPQYAALTALVIDIRRRHTVPAANIVGHDQISPGRKKDPGPLFDWERFRKALDQPATSSSL